MDMKNTINTINTMNKEMLLAGVIRIKRLHENAKIPQHMTRGAAGFDLCAVESAFVQPGATVKIGTGLAFEIPARCELQVRPRSGLSQIGIQVIVGTVDSDYRGEVCVLLHNTTGIAYRVIRGDRIAQGVLAPVIRAAFVEVDELSQTDRGANGFGSTGIAEIFKGQVVGQCDAWPDPTAMLVRSVAARLHEQKLNNALNKPIVNHEAPTRFTMENKGGSNDQTD